MFQNVLEHVGTVPPSILHRSFIDPSSTLHWSLHRSFIDPSSTHHWSLHRSFIDPSLIPSSILHWSHHRSFIDPSSTLHWSLHRSFIDPSLIPSSILHRPFISPRPPQDRPKTTQRPRQDRPLKKYWFFFKHIDFSSEKCRFGAKKSVSHYVLRRDLVIVQKNNNFELEICVKSRGGRSARCMGTPPVAEMLASEARHARTRVHVRARQGTWVARTETPLYAFSRAIDRESLAGLGNSLK